MGDTGDIRAVSAHFELIKTLVFSLPTHLVFMHIQLIKKNELILSTKNELMYFAFRIFCLLSYENNPDLLIFSYPCSLTEFSHNQGHTSVAYFILSDQTLQF